MYVLYLTASIPISLSQPQNKGVNDLHLLIRRMSEKRLNTLTTVVVCNSNVFYLDPPILILLYHYKFSPHLPFPPSPKIQCQGFCFFGKHRVKANQLSMVFQLHLEYGIVYLALLNISPSSLSFYQSPVRMLTILHF